MCMFCAAVPVAAATGTALDNKQRKKAQMQGTTPKRVRAYVILTIVVLFLLVVGSVIVHTRYGWFWI
jgi:hypothetical protein